MGFVIEGDLPATAGRRKPQVMRVRVNAGFKNPTHDPEARAPTGGSRVAGNFPLAPAESLEQILADDSTVAVARPRAPYFR